jgi:aryl-alcohol dehydrogenase-like predicted oxidoreductase
MTEPNYDLVERLENWAQARGRALYELAEAWLLANPAVCSVISGVTKVEHVINNAKAAGWKLSEEEIQQVNAILNPTN